jgi:hypothetical protein
MPHHWVYIQADRPCGTLYIGCTNDLERRIRKHARGRGACSWVSCSYDRPRALTKFGTIRGHCVELRFLNHSGDMPEGTLRTMLKQAGVSVDAFQEA